MGFLYLLIGGGDLSNDSPIKFKDDCLIFFREIINQKKVKINNINILWRCPPGDRLGSDVGL